MRPENNELENSSNLQIPERKKIDSNPQIISASYSGPIPHSSELARYEQIAPGSALRIINMAEKQSNHRQFIEEKMLEFNNKLANREADQMERGQLFAFIIARRSVK